MSESAEAPVTKKTPIGKSASQAALFAAALAGVLAVGKFTLYWKTSSLIVAMSAFDSGIDVIVSFFNHRLIRYARQDADSDHPYGHGRAESIAALGQGALIAGAALTVFSSSVQRLLHPDTIPSLHRDDGIFAISFLIFAALASLGITRFLKHFSIRFHSPALAADAAHYQTDFFSNFGSAVALCLVLLSEKMWFDPVIAGLLALYIAYSGLRMLRSTIDELMDAELPADIKERAIFAIAECSNKIIDVHKFRGRRSGHRYFFDFHITLPDNLTFREIHDISDSIEERMIEVFDADATVHVDPESLPVSAHLALSRRDPK